ncbi:hypothetical protein C0992_008235 [Termitomyces sp. T32_za158]|nr:hypothetical protein C0992_008235 [Termitomyces sp. T32_za158]
MVEGQEPLGKILHIKYFADGRRLVYRRSHPLSTRTLGNDHLQNGLENDDGDRTLMNEDVEEVTLAKDLKAI